MIKCTNLARLQKIRRRTYFLENKEESFSAEGNPPAFEVKSSDGQLSFICQKCGKTNTHRSSEGLGYRTSHCSCWPDGYYIKEVSHAK